MKLTTGILAMAMMAGGAWAQNPDAIDNARSVAKSLQQKQANDGNAALNAAGVPAKPAPGAPAPAIKPAVIPASKPAAVAAPAKPAAKPAVAAAPAAKPAVKTVSAPAAQSTTAAPASATTSAPAAKPQTAASKPATAKPPASKAATAKTASPKAAPKKPAAAAPVQVVKENRPAAPEASKPSADSSKNADAAKSSKSDEKKWSMTGKRDPFFSPVVQQAGGSGCSTGKKCLEIGQINLRGVVRSEAGFIAVVTNNMNKAYFLRESDPVFNGYVVKITGDSVVFQETVQDKLGKPFTREVVKRIFTPAV